MSLSKPKSKDIVVLSPGRKTILLAGGSIHGMDYHITQLSAVDYPEDLDTTNPGKCGIWLKSVLQKEGIKGKALRISVPREKILWTPLTIPVGSEEETRKMIELQLEKELPFPPDTASSVFYEIGLTGQNDRRIIVLTLSKDNLQYYQKLSESTGLLLDGIEPGFISINRSLKSFYTGYTTGVLLEYGINGYELSIIEEGLVKFNRDLTSGTGNIQSSEQAKKDFIAEINRNLISYSLQMNPNIPEKIWVLGDWNDSILSDITRGLNKTVEKLKRPEPSAKFPLGDWEERAFSLRTVGLMAQIEDNPGYLDFMESPLFAGEPSHNEIYYRRLIAGIVIGVLVVLGLSSVYWKKASEYQRLEKEYGVYRPMVARLEKASGDTILMDAFKNEQVSVLEVIKILSDIWGNDSYLKIMTFDRNKEIQVVGQAVSNQAVAELLNRISDTNNFPGTKLTYIRGSKRNPAFPVEFGLSLKFRSKTKEGMNAGNTSVGSGTHETK